MRSQSSAQPPSPNTPRTWESCTVDQSCPPAASSRPAPPIATPPNSTALPRILKPDALSPRRARQRACKNAQNANCAGKAAVNFTASAQPVRAPAAMIAQPVGRSIRLQNSRLPIRARAIDVGSSMQAPNNWVSSGFTNSSGANASPAQRPAIDSARAATADSATVISAVTKTRAASTDAPVTANHPRSIHIKVAGWSSHIVRYQCGSARSTRTFKSSSASLPSHGECPPSTARIQTNVPKKNQLPQRRRRRVVPTGFLDGTERFIGHWRGHSLLARSTTQRLCEQEELTVRRLAGIRDEGDT